MRDARKHAEHVIFQDESRHVRPLDEIEGVSATVKVVRMAPPRAQCRALSWCDRLLARLIAKPAHPVIAGARRHDAAVFSDGKQWTHLPTL